MTDAPPRLTSLAHGGGCGCKLSPAVLHDILATMPVGQGWANLLVGTETGDDAAVYRLNDRQALVATTDFFTPVVDDPYDFGRIAAANALSDVYAMGGAPILALAIVGMPLGKIAVGDVQQILAGGASVCQAAGIPIAGGHSIDSAEPIYGLVALGLVHPNRVMRNSGAQAGDVLVLTKGLGIGLFSAALKRGELDAADYATMLASATRLNTPGQVLPGIAGVHAVTDVTGFGLLGHTLEMCRGAGLAAELRFADVPVLPGAEALARAGVVTGAGARNWDSYGASVALQPGLPDWAAAVLCDPQTSGGLLIAVAAEAAARVMAELTPPAAVIGRMIVGLPAVGVRP
jgi:selenide,water dikinase